MEHDHSHHHEPVITQVNRALIIGILLNSLFVIIEAIAGFITHSLALITDAGHNLMDVASLALALLAFRLAKIKSNTKYTYGFRKSTILVALLNAVILLVAIGGIGYEAIQRLMNPHPLEGGVIAIVAAIGILINGFTAFLFLKDKEKDLNIKGAYLHMAADALVSLGVVIAGIVMIYTRWYWLDSAMSFIIMIVILFGTWGLLKDSVRLSLDGVPKDIDVNAVETAMLKVPGVRNVHHVHIWALSTTINALTAHLVIAENADFEKAGKIKHELKHVLEHLNIQHSTFEMETTEDQCGEKECENAAV
ncbi:MAG TPA: cation diffusion facilitator family transporter [Chitinophagaceae bacterium]